MTGVPADPVAGLTSVVIVVNYGSHELVDRNLGHLTGTDLRVVVVDNFTSPDERHSVRALCRRRGWQAVETESNLGFGAAVNLALRTVWADDVDTFLIVNPDCAMSGHVASELVSACRRAPLALVTPALETPDHRLAFEGSRVDLRSGEIRNVGSARPFGRSRLVHRGELVPVDLRDWIPGTCLAAHRQVFERIGGFDEAYFLYWEDVDLSLRCVDTGGELVVRRDLVVQHDAGATQGVQHGRAKSAVYYRYNCRNRLLFAARHVESAHRLRWALATPRVSREILLRGGRRQLLRSWRPWAATVRGSLEGLALLVLAARRHPVVTAIPRFGEAGPIDRLRDAS